MASWQQWLAKGDVKTHQTSKQEIDNLRALITRDLADAAVVALSADRRFATAYNAVAAPEAMVRIARALGASDAARGLHELAQRLGLPKTLAEIGMPESGIDRAADIAVQNAYANPRPVERASIRQLIVAAYRGEPAFVVRRPTGLSRRRATHASSRRARGGVDLSGRRL